MEAKDIYLEDTYSNDSLNTTNSGFYNLTLYADCYNCGILNASGEIREDRNASFTRMFSDWSEFLGILVTWQGVLLMGIFFILIVVTIVGNTLVILAVTTTRRLKTITNCFVMSLAVADLLVGIFVMPPAVAVHLKGSWQLGWILCDIWISLDILLCTASILSLCAISVDRYLAVTLPIKYSRRRRSKRLALGMILIAWSLAFAITCPPMLGWYELGRNYLNECRYNQNKGYVIFSAMGSFFIPMAVMVYVYAKISCVVASRHDNMTHINMHDKKLYRLSSKDIEVTLRSDVPGRDFNLRQERQIPMAGLNNQSQTDFLEQNECISLEENSVSRKSEGHELSTYTMSHKRNLPATSKKIALNEYHHTLTRHQQNSINTTTPLVNNSYITKNTRMYHQKLIPNGVSLLTKENKTTQTLSIVMGGFIVCWLPFFIYYLITPFLSKHQVSRTLAYILTWLGWFNSAINPFIYAFYNVDFRTAFWRLTLKRFVRNSPKSQFPSTTISIRR